jgi:hypothetical protein
VSAYSQAPFPRPRRINLPDIAFRLKLKAYLELTAGVE